MDEYTLRKPKQNGTLKNYHVFDAKTLANGKCRSSSTSLCEEAARDDMDPVSDCICVGEDKIRKKAAEIGRSVCGNCMAQMYGDDD